MSGHSLEHWKQLAEQYKRNYDVAQEELTEFQEQSRDLERELETQLEQSEKKNNELIALNQRLTDERNQLRERLEQTQDDSRKTISRLEEQLTQVTAQRDEHQRFIRGLEQDNDDLERATRNLSAALEDYEKRLSDTLERNALLESEVDEKDQLYSTVRHLKEETSELRQELAVRQKREKMISMLPVAVPNHDGSPNSSRSPRPSSRSGLPQPIMSTTSSAGQQDQKMDVDSPTSTVPPSLSTPPQNAKPSAIPRSITVDGVSPARTPYTPASRISALNIVGDLLRKVGALETKLASCRKYNGDDRNGGPEPKQPHLALSGSESSSETPRRGSPYRLDRTPKKM